MLNFRVQLFFELIVAAYKGIATPGFWWLNLLSNDNHCTATLMVTVKEMLRHPFVHASTNHFVKLNKIKDTAARHAREVRAVSLPPAFTAMSCPPSC